MTHAEFVAEYYRRERKAIALAMQLDEKVIKTNCSVFFSDAGALVALYDENNKFMYNIQIDGEKLDD